MNAPSTPGDAPGATATAPPAGRPPVRKQPTRSPLPSPLNVIATGLALFLVVLTLLVLQMRAGKDPSLGSGTSGAAGTSSTGSSAASSTRTVVTKTS